MNLCQKLKSREGAESGRDVLFDIDWQGTQQLYETLRDDIVSIFVLPPSARELKARLERRAEDAPAVIARRLANARVEIGRIAGIRLCADRRRSRSLLPQPSKTLTAARLKRERRPMPALHPQARPRSRRLLTEG